MHHPHGPEGISEVKPIAMAPATLFALHCVESLAFVRKKTWLAWVGTVGPRCAMDSYDWAISPAPPDILINLPPAQRREHQRWRSPSKPPFIPHAHPPPMPGRRRRLPFVARYWAFFPPLPQAASLVPRLLPCHLPCLGSLWPSGPPSFVHPSSPFSPSCIYLLKSTSPVRRRRRRRFVATALSAAVLIR
jgi:hypothetical protein